MGSSRVLLLVAGCYIFSLTSSLEGLECSAIHSCTLSMQAVNASPQRKALLDGHIDVKVCNSCTFQLVMTYCSVVIHKDIEHGFVKL